MARWCLTVLACFIALNVLETAYGSGNNCLGNSCYTFSDAESGKTWSENRATCRREGGDLVSIETEAEWRFINGKIQKLCIGVPNEWHIGLRKMGDEWQWVNGEELTVAIQNKWQPGQPSGDGDFTVMSKDWPPTMQGLFNDLANYHKRAYICELRRAASS